MSIAEAYNSWANIYDTNENKTRDLDKKATIKTLSKYSFSKVLELGCGTGKNTAFLIKKAKNITGLDFSDEMLNKARKKIKSAKVNFIKTDLTHKWQVADNWFDLVTCSLTLEHIEDLNQIFKQAHQKLQIDGYFFVCELHPYKQYTGSKARYETEKGVHVLQTYLHHLSDYLSAAQNQGFKLIEINEWFDNDEKQLPRLISFVFQK